MWLQVDPRSSIPIYQQVVDGVKTAIAKGILASGDRIPSIRELAVELTLNPNTVAKAYQELERHRVIEVVRGRGTYVAKAPSPPNLEERLQQIEETMQWLLVEGHHLKLAPEDLLVLFRNVINRWARNREEGHRDGPGGGDHQSDEEV